MTTNIDRLAGVSDGLGRKAPARFITSAPIYLYGSQAVDGITATQEGDRVLVRAQADARENGLYSASSGPWTRCLDFDGPRDVVPGTTVIVRNDTTGTPIEYVASFQAPYLPGVTSLTFETTLLVGQTDLLPPDGNTRVKTSAGKVQGFANKYVHAGFQVIEDEVRQRPNDSGTIGPKVDGWNVLHQFGGPFAEGGRHAIEGNLVQLLPTASTNTDRNYVGAQGQVICLNGDGGTPGNLLGQYFGLSASTILYAGAKNVYNATGGEINTVLLAGCSVGIHSGIQIADTMQTRGSLIDAGIMLSCTAGSTTTYGTGWFVGAPNGAPALGADSQLVYVDGNAIPVIKYGLNFPNCVVTDALIAAPNTVFGDGDLRFAKPNSSITLGNSVTTGTPNLAFKSGGNTGSAFDAKVQALGGTANNGEGALSVVASQLVVPLTRPASDNAFALGSSTFRFSQVWAATATIQTSDRRQKRDIAPVSLEFAELMLDLVDAHSYRWNDTPEQTETIATTERRQKTQPVVRPTEVEQIDIVDGKAVLRMVVEEVETQEPVFETLPVVDETGKPVVNRIPEKWQNIYAIVRDEDGQAVLDAKGRPVTKVVDRVLMQPAVEVPRVHHVPVMEDVVTEATTTTPGKANVRTHYGFIAQDIEAAILASGKTTADFAGLIIDDETGFYGLRMDQILCLLWPILKQVRAELAETKAELAQLRAA